MKHLFPVLLLLVMTLNAKSQSFCPNSDFSLGNFDNWQAFYGTFHNPESHSGVAQNRHTIMLPPVQFDPNAPDIPTIPPGDLSAARLGNSDVNYEAEVLKYTLNVTDDNNLFIYKYAVVLEDPGHDTVEQPSFTIEVKNQQGQLFDPVCGYYYVYAQPGIPGWETNSDGSIVWKNWTVVGLDLSSLSGNTVTIVFTTRDCDQGGHFGYAYLTTHCDKLMLRTGGCVSDSILNITAPPGFRYHWVTGDTTQAVTVHDPIAGDIITCELTAVNGCKVTISAVLEPTVLTADFSFVPECSKIPASFTDLTTTTYNPAVNWLWDFDDGTTDSVQNPQHIFKEPGLYHVKMVPFSSDHCSDTIMHDVLIEPYIDVELGPDVHLKNGTTKTFDAGNPGAKYLWSTGDTTRTITIGGDIMISVEVSNSLCSDYDSVMVYEYPKCIVAVPTAFSPNGDGENDVLKIFGGGIELLEFQVFDRSGQQVFSTTDMNTEWDGTFGGRRLEMAVYTYLIRGKCLDGDDFTQKGTITLLK